MAGAGHHRCGVFHARGSAGRLTAAPGSLRAWRFPWGSIWGSACAIGASRASRAIAWRSTTPVYITRCGMPGTRWPSMKIEASFCLRALARETPCKGETERLLRRVFRPASSRSGSPAVIPISAAAIPTPKSRLSDIALTWMVEEVASLPEPIAIDHSLLQLFPDGAGGSSTAMPRKAFISACPGWLVRGWRCCSSMPRTSAGAWAIGASRRMRCCIHRCSSGCGCRACSSTATSSPTARTL